MVATAPAAMLPATPRRLGHGRLRVHWRRRGSRTTHYANTGGFGTGGNGYGGDADGGTGQGGVGQGGSANGGDIYTGNTYGGIGGQGGVANGGGGGDGGNSIVTGLLLNADASSNGTISAIKAGDVSSGGNGGAGGNALGGNGGTYGTASESTAFAARCTVASATAARERWRRRYSRSGPWRDRHQRYRVLAAGDLPAAQTDSSGSTPGSLTSQPGVTPPCLRPRAMALREAPTTPTARRRQQSPAPRIPAKSSMATPRLAISAMVARRMAVRAATAAAPSRSASSLWLQRNSRPHPIIDTTTSLLAATAAWAVQCHRRLRLYRRQRRWWRWR